MTNKPWREVAHPHKDVLEGTFKQSEFAADISQVHSGTAPGEYQDAEKFFSRTFITEGMRLLLRSVIERLSGQGGDPVIQLQTAFGGGKTHTLLAVYHLASRQCATDKLQGIPPILDEVGVASLPSAKVAVLDGIQLSISASRKVAGIEIKTIWGDLAYQLMGLDGYRMVEASDADGTSPGKAVLVELLKAAAPCVVLADELVAYVRQFEPGKRHPGGTYDSNLTFIQALTEAMKSVPNAMLLASLPESEAEVGGVQGQQTLAALEKYFGRVESVWKPVASEEAFEIVRRRLFDDIGDAAQVQATAKAFGEYYRENTGKFPAESQEARYEERIVHSYPIHPEVFDRLYEDWSTLDKFQRTRGVLQYMAIVIHRLWNNNDKDPLIMPGSLPLDDAAVRNKSVHYLPNGWEPVIEKEVDGDRSEPHSIDGKDTRFGSINAACRTARTIFLGSAPSNSAQAVRGINVERILLGSSIPGQVPGTYQDVIKRLRDRLTYLYGEKDSYWFDTRPNLRREMESRKANLDEKNDVMPCLQSRVSQSFARSSNFAGIHVFTSSADIPDEYGNGIRLVVLPPHAAFRKQSESMAIDAATEILEKRGDAPRLKQNRLIFLAPDMDAVPRLKDQIRTFMAWSSIVADAKEARIGLSVFEVKQAENAKADAEQHIRHLIRETYRWLLCPAQEMIRGKMTLRWESVAVSPSAQVLTQEIENKLKEEEWVVYEWSPIHLRNTLRSWYLKDGTTEISALKVWQDSCHYLYLPRLLNDHVFKDAISAGLNSEDFFGFASGKEGDKYLGFHFGEPAIVNIDASSLLIDSEAAAEYRDAQRPPEPAPLPPGEESGDTAIRHTPPQPPTPDDKKPGEETPAAAVKTQFFGTVRIDPVMAKLDFAKVADEIIEHFTSSSGVEVEISVDIRAVKRDGFDGGIQRTVNENSNVLRFITAEFEE